MEITVKNKWKKIRNDLTSYILTFCDLKTLKTLIAVNKQFSAICLIICQYQLHNIKYSLTNPSTFHKVEEIKLGKNVDKNYIIQNKKGDVYCFYDQGGIIIIYSFLKRMIMTKSKFNKILNI